MIPIRPSASTEPMQILSVSDDTMFGHVPRAKWGRLIADQEYIGVGCLAAK